MGLSDGFAGSFFIAPLRTSDGGVLAGVGATGLRGTGETDAFCLLPRNISAVAIASTMLPSVISRRSRLFTRPYFKYRRMNSAAARSRTRMPAEGGADEPATTTPAR